MVREEIRKLIDQIRVEKKFRKKKQVGDVVMTETGSMVSLVKNEMDDLDKFMQDFAESELRNRKEIHDIQLKSQMPQSVVQPK